MHRKVKAPVSMGTTRFGKIPNDVPRLLKRIAKLGEASEVQIAYEDDLDNVAMYGRAGVHVVYVHSGYYDQGKARP